MRAANVPDRVHLIGAGGAHMSAIAQILHAWGHAVSGSDQRANRMTEKLTALGMPIVIGHSAENVGDAELVVMTSAAHGDNPEIIEAERRGIPIIKRAEMVARLMQGRYSIAVAGTHGKTTTSGLIAHMLVEAGLDPTYLIGGEVRSLGTNAAPGEGRYIVVEADEYDRAFLSYTPDVAIVTNIEPDHLDIYGTAEEMTAAFARFMASAPPDGHVIACADSPRVRATLDGGGIAARDVQTYALDEAAASWRAGGATQHESGQSFPVSRDGREFGVFTISLPGRHNVSNALAGIVAGNTIGLGTGVMQSALASYRGAERRFEHVGEAGGVTILDDYAHHPTEVSANIQATRERFPGRRLVVLFQPHTYTRTAYLLEEWKTCFVGADALYITHTYAAREEPSAGLSGTDLAREITAPSPVYIEEFAAAANAIARDLRRNDVLMTFGAGDVDSVGRRVLELLQRGSA